MAETKELQERTTTPNAAQQTEERKTVQPRGAVWSEIGKVIVRLEMPGVSKDNLSIHVDDDKLLIYGKRTGSMPEGRYIVRERRNADYARTYTLDETIDRGNIDAVLENGIVTITLHMTESARPRKIEVRRA